MLLTITEKPLIEPIFSISTVTVCFIIYHFFTQSSSFTNYFLNRFSQDQASIRSVLAQRLTGMILFGLIPAVLILFFIEKDLSQFGLSGSNITRSILWFLPAAAVIITLNYFGSKRKNNLRKYPQIRVREWNKNLLTLSAFSWIAYLFTYEFLFRGFLLFSCAAYFNTWIAITINTSIYALVHLPKGIKETVGAIPFGIILCWLVLYLDSIWIALFIHIILALSNEWFSLATHPEMKFTRHKNQQV